MHLKVAISPKLNELTMVEINTIDTMSYEIEQTMDTTKYQADTTIDNIIVKTVESKNYLDQKFILLQHVSIQTRQYLYKKKNIYHSDGI